MSSNLKESWKETGKGLGHAFKDLGKTLIKTAEAGVDKAVDWAERDDRKTAAEAKVVSEKTICEKCGAQNNADAAYCYNCGKKLGA